MLRVYLSSTSRITMATIQRRELTLEHCEFDESLPLLLRRIYAARGVTSMDALEKGLEQLISYENLLNIHKAAAFLHEALSAQKNILVVGDFDTDGATSTALMVSALRTFGGKNIQYLVPNRFEYGYGLSPEIVEVAAQRNPHIIITVDNGISSIEGVQRAKELGIKVLVTDHHLAGNELPEAEVIVNPNQPHCTFPSKALAGVGVAFYVLLALRSYLREKNWFSDNAIAEPNMGEFLDLVAVGTVADVVPLDHVNRILVHQGLKRIRLGRMRPGIRALLEVSGRSCVNLVASDLGFAVAPRLNAAGRLDDMSLGVELLLSQDAERAKTLAVQLNELNLERRVIEADMQQQAFSALDKLHLEDGKILARGLCLYDPQWHQGVIGILASRIKDKFHRPVIAFAKSDDQYIKGSARSIQGLHIRDVLDAIATKNPSLILRFGGHAMAAGLTLLEENFNAFSKAFNEEVSAQLREEDLLRTLYSDGELDLNEYCINTAELLRDAGPWGQAFPEPLFDGEFRILEQRLVGAKHLKMSLGMEGSLMVMDAIAFNVDLNEWPSHRCEHIRAAYRLDINEYRGKRTIQLVIEHMEAIK